jgi:hypothetical protein
MTWWLVPLILVVIGAGTLTGLNINNVFSGRQGRGLTHFFKHHLDVETKPLDSVPVSISPEETSINRQPLGNINDIVENSPEASTKEPSFAIAALENGVVTELVYNLATADKPLNGRLNIFQTDVWDNQRGEFDALDPEIKWRLTQVYTDMFLANNVVRLTKELGGDNKNMVASYLELKSKIAENLQQVLPSIKSALN